MMLNYDFLEMVDEPRKTLSLTEAIDKAMENKSLMKATKPSVRVLGKSMPLSKFLDAVGDEISRLKYDTSHKIIKGSTIESANLNSIVNKIKSGLPFGTISAFRPFRPAFEKDFTEDQQKALIKAYKSGYSKDDADKITQYWQNKPTKIDLHKPIKAKDFFKGNTNIYRTLRNLFGQKFMDRYIDPESETTMRDFMSSDKFVKKYRYTYKDNMQRTRQLKSLLDSKRHFLGYIQVIGYWKDNPKDALLPDKEVSFFVFQNEPSNTFDLSSELLLLARHFNQAAICYCDNAKTDKVELVSAEPETFGKVWSKFTDITFTLPLTQSITRLHNKVYTFFEKKNMENYGVSFEELSTTKIKAMSIPKIADEFYRHLENRVKSFIRARQYHGSPRTFDADDIEKYELQAIKERENRKKVLNASFRQSYENALKVNNLVNALLQGKKASKRLIASVLANTTDTDAGYCFISPTDLATQLDNISPRLSKSIVTAIEQAEGVRLTYALIDKISYNSLHNILNFIFDIDNPLSDQSFNQLVIEVLREALKNVKLPQVKKVLTAQIFDGAYRFRGDDFKYQYQTSPELLD
ncbi:hypothetical protein [Helicobacter pylori]|uniref:hypothetical protein n=1 Tax=Helicobacter pylori TaxID=210 RepID=UPI0005355C68|nr:hypothetical protein [Helicobacter pylori]